MRFKYESPGFFEKAAIRFGAPHRWRSGVRPWVFDKVSGVRFQLAHDEEAVLNQLAACTAKRRPTPHLDGAFDYVADAMVKRRIGYVSEWRSLSNWAPDDWDRWLSAIEEQP
jgi:hypothetical protein